MTTLNILKFLYSKNNTERKTLRKIIVACIIKSVYAIQRTPTNP